MNQQQAANQTYQRIAFRMKLHEGQEAEYKKRHAELWPELATLLKQTGISEYSIFLDETTLDLFAFFKAIGPEALDALPQQPIMQRWWTYMRDLMDCNEDDSPVAIPLEEVFYLP